VIEAYEKHWKPRRRRNQKLLTEWTNTMLGIFETQYRQILFKLKLEDFQTEGENLSGGQQKRLSCYFSTVLTY
jgi:ATP-binding cassette subfamily F protein uup